MFFGTGKMVRLLGEKQLHVDPTLTFATHFDLIKPVKGLQAE